ncbi:hypothetical protein F8388_017716 [Cannabis sativa]|uniref:Uncharacterized protein n=1 Tax=Cannabis sativa TaxID=3483 RepID=A0A7J6HJY2_CANSA|nr:hypothetical protein F8388_017716 [Cannabis sativa]
MATGLLILYRRYLMAKFRCGFCQRQNTTTSKSYQATHGSRTHTAPYNPAKTKKYLSCNLNSFKNFSHGKGKFPTVNIPRDVVLEEILGEMVVKYYITNFGNRREKGKREGEEEHGFRHGGDEGGEN